jgi:hypothetical protein
MINPHLVRPNHFYASDTLMYLLHSHQGELRLVARLTAVYHNSIVKINTQTKDLNGQIHWHADEDVVAPPELLTLEDSDSLSCTEESTGSKDVECWDEDEYGDQAYNDQAFEMNEDLVPWNETGDGAEERWGLWL